MNHDLYYCSVQELFPTDFTGGDGSTLVRAMDEAMDQRQPTPKATTPAGGTTLGSSVTHRGRTPEAVPTVPVDEEETQDPTAGMEGWCKF